MKNFSEIPENQKYDSDNVNYDQEDITAKYRDLAAHQQTSLIRAINALDFAAAKLIAERNPTLVNKKSRDGDTPAIVVFKKFLLEKNREENSLECAERGVELIKIFAKKRLKNPDCL